MANFNWLQQWAEHGRKMGHSVFDLEKRMCFHIPNAMILPIRFIETVPDDHFVLSLSGLMRTETMNRAAFYQGKAVFSAFFVPYKQLWHNFNQFVVLKNDKHSTEYKGSAYVPNIELKLLIEFVAKCFYFQVKDSFGYTAAWSWARLLQYCKIFNMFPLLHYIEDSDFASWSDCFAAISTYTVKFKGRYVNLWRLLAYQHIFYDVYRNKYYDDNCFFTYYDNEISTQEYIQSFNVDWISCNSEASSHFLIRLDDIGQHGPDVFNDEYDCLLANILDVHYCQFRKDLYTSLLPSTQFGAVSGLSFTPNVSFGSNILSDLNGLYNTDGNPVTGDNLQINNGTLQIVPDETPVNVGHRHTLQAAVLNNSMSKLPSSFDVLELRRAELLQQWKQNALRAGNMVDSNFESHFGVKPYYEDDNNVRFLGSWECQLNTVPVTATAETTGSVEVGDLAAYGVGQINGRDIDVQIKDFGVVVVCAHFTSETYYNANGIDKQNTLIEPFDYFQSEFENAGLDSVHAWQQSTGFVEDETLDTVFGYTPPYTMYKTEVDEVFGEYSEGSIYDGDDWAFNWQGSLSAWTTRRSDLYMDDGGSGDYWTTVLPLNRFYQSPKLTDTVFGVKYDAKGSSDPFGFAINLGVKAIRPMSVLGIPIFG